MEKIRNSVKLEFTSGTKYDCALETQKGYTIADIACRKIIHFDVRKQHIRCQILHATTYGVRSKANQYCLHANRQRKNFTQAVWEIF